MSRSTSHILPFDSRPRVVQQQSTGSLEWARLKTHLRLWQKWWLRPHRSFQPVFVIATCRSGSNLLVSYLKQQPEVAMLSEVLCSQLPYGPRRDRIPASQAIRHIRYCLQGERGVVRGCKLMLHQLADCQLSLDDLQREFPKAKFIILYRQALAEQFVSLKIAEATRQFTLGLGESPRRTEVAVNPAELRAYCDDVRRRYRDALSSPWLAERAVLLSYEELVANPAGWLKQEICPLLGVPFHPPETRLLKQNTRPLAEQVFNYREVAGLLHSPLCRQYHDLPGRGVQRKAA
jgi:LPS sulfotransferase NodH